MPLANQMNVMGVDGCPAGWVAVRHDGADFSAAVYADLETLWRANPDAARIWLDMPIGLMENSRRRVDADARERLKPLRHHSVFSAPVRALAEDATLTYALACVLSREKRGKAISQQTWHILPKIREADALLRAHPAAQRVIAESHPEVVFAVLNGGHPMRYNKKHLMGRAERLDVLSRYFADAAGFAGEFFNTHRRAACGYDDLIDALALAVGAGFAQVTAIPETPEYDALGLPARMMLPVI